MRTQHLFALALAVLSLAAGPASSCTVSGAHVSGSFDSEGHFVVATALDAQGAPMEKAAGVVLESMTAEEDVALPASDAGATIWVKGDLDFDNRTLHVLGWTDSAEEAKATVAAARAASPARKPIMSWTARQKK